MSVQRKMSSPFASIAAFVLSLLGKRKLKSNPDDFARMEFKTSTQRLGVSFTQRIRDVFRFKWIKKS